MVLFSRLSLHGSYAGQILPALVVTGVGFGSVFAGAFSTGTLSVELANAGVSAAAVNTSQQIDASVGTALLSTVFAGAVSLWAVGVTSFAAVRAVSPRPGEVVAVSGAAGGVGASAVQLARRTGARVLGIAAEQNADWLRSVGVEPVAYGNGLTDRLPDVAPQGIDAFIDTHGGGYVGLAVDLGVPAERIDTIIDFAGAQRHGARTEASPQASTPAVLALMADHVAWGRLIMPITAVYPLEEVRQAYTDLAAAPTHGKIALATGMAAGAEPLRRTSR
jgi:NADPH-dependent curcumin reductase CurA